MLQQISLADRELFAEFVYDKAFGAGASGNLGTELLSPFLE